MEGSVWRAGPAGRVVAWVKRAGRLCRERGLMHEGKHGEGGMRWGERADTLLYHSAAPVPGFPPRHGRGPGRTCSGKLSLLVILPNRPTANRLRQICRGGQAVVQAACRLEQSVPVWRHCLSRPTSHCRLDAGAFGTVGLDPPAQVRQQAQGERWEGRAPRTCRQCGAASSRVLLSAETYCLQPSHLYLHRTGSSAQQHEAGSRLAGRSCH